MDKKGFLDVPCEILEHICSYMALFDIARLEQSNKKLRATIQETRVWRKEAERLHIKFNYQLIGDMLTYMKDNNIGEGKYYKITIGIMAHTKKIVGDLERAAKQYKTDGELEMEKYQNQDPPNQTGRQFNLWLRRMVKLFIQEELMRAKMHQILGYNENLVIKKEDDLESVTKIADARISELFKEEDPDVMENIRKYEDWIRTVYKPTDEEVMYCAQTKSHHFLDTIRHILIEYQLPQD
eukprot:GFUD01008888.1.p1 GENE.GFUD01008888.1~~GFUD01008888.1.p1  ORF type:complete len:239 (+),score=52.17 GFUD01008888.1:52-768(+)